LAASSISARVKYSCILPQGKIISFPVSAC
jgi:hypothetical protein